MVQYSYCTVTQFNAIHFSKGSQETFVRDFDFSTVFPGFYTAVVPASSSGWMVVALAVDLFSTLSDTITFPVVRGAAPGPSSARILPQRPTKGIL